MRAALPAKVPLADAVANLRRVALGVAGLATGRPDLLRQLTRRPAPRAVPRGRLPAAAGARGRGPRRPARSAPACPAPAAPSSRSSDSLRADRPARGGVPGGRGGPRPAGPRRGRRARNAGARILAPRRPVGRARDRRRRTGAGPRRSLAGRAPGRGWPASVTPAGVFARMNPRTRSQASAEASAKSSCLAVEEASAARRGRSRSRSARRPPTSAASNVSTASAVMPWSAPPKMPSTGAAHEPGRVGRRRDVAPVRSRPASRRSRSRRRGRGRCVAVMNASRPPKQKPIVKIARTRPSPSRERSAAAGRPTTGSRSASAATCGHEVEVGRRSRTPIPAVRPK